ncbi:MAG: hypothetical protein AAF211_13375 [Myxococcota bacterium]
MKPPRLPVSLRECATLLQRVHFPAHMLGYDVYLDRWGEVASQPHDPLVTIQVRGSAVSLVAHVDGVAVGFEPLAPDREASLEDGRPIEIPGLPRMEYRDHRTEGAPGWGYLGEIRRPAWATPLAPGQTHLIGRSRECRVVLPDHHGTDNIHWVEAHHAGASIQSPTGRIARSRFYTDAIMVAAEMVAVDLGGGPPVLRSRANYVYTYLRRGGKLLPLHPLRAAGGVRQRILEAGDEILVGNQVFRVEFG